MLSQGMHITRSFFFVYAHHKVFFLAHEALAAYVFLNV
jgi:hypothetical protein